MSEHSENAERRGQRSGRGSGMQAPPGLKGVEVADTELGGVRGDEGFFHYRQYSAIDLARERTLEEAWYLLFEGRLPDPAELAGFRAELASLRTARGADLRLLEAIGRLGHGGDPLELLRAALAQAAAGQSHPTLGRERRERRLDALRVCCEVPIFAASLWRVRNGESPLRPDPSLSYAADYLRMLTGRVPDAARTRALEQYLISTIDHGFSASTFTARVIASTGADVASAVIGALGAFAGPLHGGSLARALDPLDAIGSEANVEPWLRARIESGERVMGFGHAVYRTEDPRARMLREIASELGGERIELARQIERTTVALLAEIKPGRALYANVEFYAGVLLELCGLPREMFTSTFATSRVIGWCAHVLEQTDETCLIRPSARYVGPGAPAPLPERSPA